MTLPSHTQLVLWDRFCNRPDMITQWACVSCVQSTMTSVLLITKSQSTTLLAYWIAGPDSLSWLDVISSSIIRGGPLIGGSQVLKIKDCLIGFRLYSLIHNYVSRKVFSEVVQFVLKILQTVFMSKAEWGWSYVLVTLPVVVAIEGDHVLALPLCPLPYPIKLSKVFLFSDLDEPLRLPMSCMINEACNECSNGISCADATSTTLSVRIEDCSNIFDFLRDRWSFGGEPELWMYWN